MMIDRTIGIALILSTGLLWTLYVLNADSPVRIAVAAAWLLIAPGLAVVRLLDLKQWWVEAVLSVALSLAIVTVTTTALLLADRWTPERAFAIVGCITLLAAGTRLVTLPGSPGLAATAHPGMERHDDGR